MSFGNLQSVDLKYSSSCNKSLNQNNSSERLISPRTYKAPVTKIRFSSFASSKICRKLPENRCSDQNQRIFTNLSSPQKHSTISFIRNTSGANLRVFGTGICPSKFENELPTVKQKSKNYIKGARKEFNSIQVTKAKSKKKVIKVLAKSPKKLVIHLGTKGDFHKIGAWEI